MINPEDAAALTPALRMFVASWTDEERQHVHEIFRDDTDIRLAIVYIMRRRAAEHASAAALQEKYG